MKLLATLLLGITAFAQAEVKVTVDSVEDRRSSGKFPGGLDITLKVSGPELAASKGVRVTFTAAVDDTGKNLQSTKNDFSAQGARDFKPLTEGFGFGNEPKKKGEGEMRVSLQNPARAAKSAKLTGNLEILNPAADPQSVITVKLATEAGKPLANEALKAGGVQLTFEPVKEDEASYKITDANEKVAAVEFCAADGTPLKIRGSGFFGFGSALTKSVTLEKKAPAGMIAKIYLLTEKAVTKIPLKLDQVVLP